MIRAVDGQQLAIPLENYWLLFKGKYRNGGGYKVTFERHPLLRSEWHAIPLEAAPFIEALGIPLQIHPHRRYAEKGQYTSPYIRVYAIYVDYYHQYEVRREVADYYSSIGLTLPHESKSVISNDLEVQVGDGQVIWLGKKPNGNCYKLYVRLDPHPSWDPGTIYPESIPFLMALGITLMPHKRKEMAAKGCKMSPYVFSDVVEKDRMAFIHLSPQLKDFYDSVDCGNEVLAEFLLQPIKDSVPAQLPDFFVLPQVAPDSSEEDQDFESLWLEVSGHNG